MKRYGLRRGVGRLALFGEDDGGNVGPGLGQQAVHGVARPDQLGRMFGGGLSEREVQYLIDNEWARTVEDILWRRTKMGLRLTPQQAAGLSEWLAGRATAMA